MIAPGRASRAWRHLTLVLLAALLAGPAGSLRCLVTCSQIDQPAIVDTERPASCHAATDSSLPVLNADMRCADQASTPPTIARRSDSVVHDIVTSPEWRPDPRFIRSARVSPISFAALDVPPDPSAVPLRI